jgi:demethylmenaquinone methyltransferase/2-methoxy-6-polyprenyl-1,4-benzoquinol methylase
MTTSFDQAAYVNAQIRSLEDANPLREPALRSIIKALSLAPGSHGLDIGCGIGLQTPLLVEAVGAHGHVTGLDISAELLAYAQHKISSLSCADQITFKQGDMGNLPFPDHSFDWVWSADCVGYPSGELLPVLTEIKRVLHPGGSIVILAWTSQQLLPGHALLEARLNADCSPYAPYLEGMSSACHFMRALHGFSKAGLVKAAARTFVGEVQAPLNAEYQTALVSLFEMLWGGAQSASQADRLEYQRLCRANSPDFILNLPDYYAFFTYTLFSAHVVN